jgi:hypothetical protein
MLDFFKFRPLGENRLWDMVVRIPLNEEERETPVGIVSKRYKLVQHTELFQRACDAIRKAGVEARDCEGELRVSAYGTRMAVTFTLPDKFKFDPGDGSPLSLCLYCVNSVDASSRLTITLGWFRFICGNGLIVGTARLNQTFVHNESMDLPDVAKVLSQGLSLAEKEKVALREWVKETVPQDRLEAWVDGALRDSWGPLAAARVYHICRTGMDARFANCAEKALPHHKKMIPTKSVPGSPSPANNAYHICQALSWVAKERRQIQDQLDGMQQLPELMKALLQ